MTTNPAFTDFLREQMRTHELDSVRQLSAWLGLSNSVVWSVMEGKQDPGLDFMIAVSRATGVNLADLVELARPGALARTDLSLDARILAQQVETLPDDLREAVRAIIRGARYGDRAKDRQQRG